MPEIIADVQQWQAMEAIAGALFQVPSQFNLLETVSSQVTPEQGIGRYDYERTQGPACAIATEAGRRWSMPQRSVSTIVRGGTFGYRAEWIRDAIYRALSLYPDTAWEVVIVSQGSSIAGGQQLAQKFQT